ncbi:MAG TPA: hypothetical protein VIN59_04840 [Alphaproteobacteria bacterium]
MWWFLLWLIFAGVVLTFMGWSLNILLAQRKAWMAFADKYKLAVDKEGQGWITPVFLRGAIQNRDINIYSQNESEEGRRLSDVYTHIEVFLNTIPPAKCILAKRALPRFLADVSLPQKLEMSSSEWPKPSVAMTDDPIILANWLTGQRLIAFKGFMDMAGRDDEPMLIADGEQAFLLWRTRNPLRDPRELNAVVQKLFGFAKEFDGTPK